MKSFLSPLLAENGERLGIVNTRTGAIVVRHVERAFDSPARNRGLLGRDGLPESTGLALAPCNAVHTFFMRFDIDVVFLDARGVVRRIVRGLRPWRASACLRGHAVLETAAGVIERSGTMPGDRLTVAALPSEAATSG